MHLLVVTSMCLLMVMQYVHVLFFKSKLWQVYLTKMCTRLTVLSEVTISARGYNPLLFAMSFKLHTKTETTTFLLRAFRCRCSSVCQVVGHWE